MHDAKVTFYMSYFSIRKIILHWFHVDNNEGESDIGYDMIIGCDLMTNMGIMSDFKRQVLPWDGTYVPTKEPGSILGQTYSTIRKMSGAVMHTS